MANLATSIRHLRGRARRFGWRAAANVALWVDPETNPFINRDGRIEARQGQPLRTLAWLGLFWLLLCIGGWHLWLWVLREEPRWARTFNPAYWLPKAVGGDVFGAAALFTVGACGWAALLTTGGRAARLLREEVLRGTLDQLQLLPQREERWLWMMRARPLVMSLLCYFVGLPIYFFAIALGHWSLIDLFGLLLVFLLIGHMAPTWQPVAWQTQQGKATRWDMRAWQAALKQLREENKQLGTGEIAQLEAQRRLARVWTEIEPVAASVPEASENAAKDKKRGAAAKGNAAQSGAAQSGALQFGGPRWMWIWLAFQFGFPMISALGSVAGNPIGPWFTHIRESLPDAVRAMTLSLPIGWPLLLERTLLAPLPFFRWSLPMAALLLPLWAAWQFQQNLALASQVSSCETFWTARRTRLRRTAGRLSLALITCFFFGFGWQPWFADGAFAGLLRDQWLAYDTNVALAAAWTLALVVTSIIASSAHERVWAQAAPALDALRAPVSEEPPTAAEKHARDAALATAYAETWQAAALAMLRPLAVAIGFYFVFCWLGGESGFSKAWWQRLWPTAATAVAFLVTDFGAAALQSGLSPTAREISRKVRLAWFGAPVLLLLALMVFYSRQELEFSFADAPWVLVSPFVSVLALFRLDLNSGVPWWTGPMLQLAIGLPCLFVAALRAFKPSTAVSAPSETSPRAGEGTPQPWWLRALWPLRKVGQVLFGLWQGAVALYQGAAELVRRSDEGVIQWSAKFGNPVFTAEIKRRIRREHWPLQWLLIPLGGAWWLWRVGIPMFGPGAGMGPNGREFVTISTVVASLLLFFASLGAGSIFDRDRANGTLIFLFLTPLTEKEIIGGKIRAAALHCLGLGACLPLFLLYGCLLGPRGTENLWLQAALSLIGILGGLFFVLMVQLISAVCASKPGQAAGGGFAAIVFSHIFVLMAYQYADALFNFNIELKTVATAVWFVDLFTAIGLWFAALHLFRRQRYSERLLRGKTSG